MDSDSVGMTWHTAVSSEVLTTQWHRVMAEPLVAHGSTSPSPGADINTQASDSASALYEACKNEHEDVVEFLLSQGADANKANKDGLLPLHVASKKGNYRSVRAWPSPGAVQLFRDV